MSARGLRVVGLGELSRGLGSSEHGDSTSHRVDSASRVSQEVDFDFDFDQGLTS